MDNNFTEEIRLWLEAPARDYNKGALLLLKLSGNRIMYNNVVVNTKAHAGYIDYNIQKYYNFRVQNLTHTEVQKMSDQCEIIVKDHISNTVPVDEFKKGKREDHDSLPLEVQAMFTENLGITQRMREVQMKLRSISLADTVCLDSERFPYLKELIELDKRLHKNWDVYDHYIPGPNQMKVFKFDAVAESKNALRLVNLNKGKYATNPTDEMRIKLIAWYSKVINPTKKLEAELQKLGII